MPGLSCVARAIAERYPRYPASGTVSVICAHPSPGGCRCTLCTLLSRSSWTATWHLKRMNTIAPFVQNARARSGARAKLPLCPAPVRKHQWQSPPGGIPEDIHAARLTEMSFRRQLYDSILQIYKGCPANIRTDFITTQLVYRG